MTFRANKNGSWVGGDDQSQGTTVYGKLGNDWLYAKSVWANNNGTWTRAWTDCRQHDAGGRDWGSSSSSSTVSCGGCGGCGTNTKVVTTVTYTKEGCPVYTRASETGCTGCTGSWSAVSSSTLTFDGVEYTYVGPAGYYAVYGIGNPSVPGCGSCPTGCYREGSYFIEVCNLGGYRGQTSPLSCSICANIFGEPC
jgi:hypothetical protein